MENFWGPISFTCASNMTTMQSKSQHIFLVLWFFNTIPWQFFSPAKMYSAVINHLYKIPVMTRKHPSLWGRQSYLNPSTSRKRPMLQGGATIEK
jgi:hypothetical protein